MNQIFEIRATDGSETVTLQTAKDWLRVTSQDDDTIITDLIKVARRRIERYAIRSMVNKTIVLTGEITEQFLLPYAPINAVTQVRLLKGQTSTGENDWEILDADEYQLIGYTQKHFKARFNGTYEITYTTLADTDNGLTNDLKRVLLWLYENRGDDTDSIPIELMSNAKQVKDLSYL